MGDLRKPYHRHANRRVIVIILLACAVAALSLVLLHPNPEVQNEPAYALPDYGEIMAHSQSEVKAIQVTMRDGQSWTLQRDKDNSYYVDGQDGFPVS